MHTWFNCIIMLTSCLIMTWYIKLKGKTSLQWICRASSLIEAPNKRKERTMKALCLVVKSKRNTTPKEKGKAKLWKEPTLQKCYIQKDPKRRKEIDYFIIFTVYVIKPKFHSIVKCTLISLSCLWLLNYQGFRILDCVYILSKTKNKVLDDLIYSIYYTIFQNLYYLRNQVKSVSWRFSSSCLVLITRES